MEAADDELVCGILDALIRFDLVVESDVPARCDLNDDEGLGTAEVDDR
jgi:hypothetical protein